MAQIGLCFLARGNRKLASHRTDTEPLDLRKDEPHPVTLLLSVSELSTHFFEDAGLRLDESLEIVRIQKSLRLLMSLFRVRRETGRQLEVAGGREMHGGKS